MKKMNTVKKFNQNCYTQRNHIYKNNFGISPKKYISYFDISWNEYTITR